MSHEPSVYQRRRSATRDELAHIPWLERLTPREREIAAL